MKKISLFIAVAFMLSSCSVATHYIQDDASAKPAVQPETVKIYSGDLSHDYDVIGSVAVDVVGTGKDAAQRLRIEAGKIGANAVIFVKLTKLSSPADRTGLSGVAVFVK
jgi:hypothetical protein